MRRRRTIYFNDARHYYLFVFEPPITMEEAWRPVDEVAGTAVDTFAYGVARGDGLFYPSKVGLRFGEDIQPFEQAAYWRVWHNMQSLMDRGLDPLTVLIDRAHERGMDFIASLRMGSHGGMDPALDVANGGRGFVHPEVRDHQLAVLTELATDYATEGVELDFASAPGGGSFCLREDDVEEHTSTVTRWVREVASMARGRSGKAALVGARVYPTAAMCAERGLDVGAWFAEGLVDYVVPMLYIDFILDPDMPIGWLVDAAHDADVPVYGMLQPYVRGEGTGAPERVYASRENMRAAASSFWDRGVDGLYTWFMRWPLGAEQRSTLSELGDPALIEEADKHYVVRRRSERALELGYDAALPVEIGPNDLGARHAIPFNVGDDIERAPDRVRRVRLRLRIRDLVSGDDIKLVLNGRSLSGEPCVRDYGDPFGPYSAQWLELDLRDVRPRKGENVLEVQLDARPDGLAGTLVVEELEVLVEYGSYPSRLGR